MKTQKLKSAPGPEVDPLSARNITNNHHLKETRDLRDEMIAEMTVATTEKEVIEEVSVAATLVIELIEVIENKDMNATKDLMIGVREETTIDIKVAAIIRTNTIIMTDTAVVTTDTRLTTIINSK